VLFKQAEFLRHDERGAIAQWHEPKTQWA